MNTPTGISEGKKTVRAMMSAIMTIKAPINADPIARFPKDLLRRSLAICGAIKPTKAIPPAIIFS